MGEAMFSREQTDTLVSEQRIILDSAESIVIREARSPLKIFVSKATSNMTRKLVYYACNFSSLCLVRINIILSQKYLTPLWT
jgi:preprotein translocase subunit SecA